MPRSMIINPKASQKPETDKRPKTREVFECKERFLNADNSQHAYSLLEAIQTAAIWVS